MCKISFSNIEIDILKEVNNIGIGNAATCLSQILDRRINISIPKINITTIDSLASSIESDKEVVGIIVKFSGELQGSILFVSEKSISENLIYKLTGEEHGLSSEIGKSAICEVVNILSAAYLNAISKLTNMESKISIPYMIIDLECAIIPNLFIEMGQLGDNILNIKTLFTSDLKCEFVGDFYYIPKLDDIKNILNRLCFN